MVLKILTVGACSSPLAKQEKNCSTLGCIWQKKSPSSSSGWGVCKAWGEENPQQSPKESDGALILMLTRVRGGFPAEQNPEAQEHEVSESFWGAQLQAEGIRWTRLLQRFSSCLTLHLNHPAPDTACVYSSKPFLPFVGTHHHPQSHKNKHLRICFISKTF